MNFDYLILLIISFLLISLLLLLVVLIWHQRKIDKAFKEAIYILDYEQTELLTNDIKSIY